MRSLKAGKAIYLEGIFFCYVCWNSLYIPTAMNKSNSQIQKRRKICGCRRPVISLSARALIEHDC